MPALPNRIWVLGSASALAFALSIYFYLCRFPDPPGIDGYFYLKQILSLGRNFEFYFKDYSLAFLPPALIGRITGDELLAFRASIAFAMGLFVWTQWVFVARLAAGPKLFFPALALAQAVLIFNFPFYELAFGYLKTLTALIFTVWALICVTDALEKNGPYWPAAFPALLALLTHKTSFLLLALAVTAWLLQKFKIRTAAIAAAAFAAAILLFALLFSQGRHYLQFLWANIGFAPSAHYAWGRELWAQANFLHISMAQAAVFLFFYAGRRATLKPSLKFVADFILLFSLLAWLPLYKPGQDEPVYRILLIYASLIPPLIFALLLRAEKFQFVSGALAGLLLCQFSLGRPVAALIPNYDQYSAEVAGLEKFVGPEDHLICHHGLEFYVDYKTRIRCQIFLSEKPGQKTFRLLYAPPETAWMKTRILSEPKSLMPLGLTYLLVREDDWQALVQKEKFKNNWRNPSDYRPGHIYAP